MYRGRKERLPHEIIINSSIFVEEAISYDNWNNGTYGHNVILFLDEDTIGKISSLKLQKDLISNIKSDLKTLTENIPNEFIESLWIELADDSNLDYQSSVKFTSQPIVNPDNLTIWKPEYIRLFISHKDEHKKEATLLAKKLEAYGISSFVAHDTIEPLEKWQNTIIKGLQSMEVMMVFVTDVFPKLLDESRNRLRTWKGRANYIFKTRKRSASGIHSRYSGYYLRVRFKSRYCK